ncbi:2-methoxy-6-polyprenyl-1,4-benzoquinol methylase, mitochondrial-like [Stomoxys calcitrans]|uniref:2-methoxy-6-polyprenyl-1,4-benzoquinol methylase, mitochondrial n=1 Tax=Stomoxys calcitrans TaxID=35570 RepID=A0A1I8PEA6_STOCA|nr:2-methoxy-6-polyprenyl-1,4-benzoquinol methylase, mitochondrial-like [Stomoxys calcitrans]
MNSRRVFHWKSLSNLCQHEVLLQRNQSNSYQQTAKMEAYNDRVSETHKSSEKRTKFFGSEQVTPGERNQKVNKMFTDMADSYDRLLDVMSLGMHRVWKDMLVNKLAPQPGICLLDMAGGTGDIPIRVLKHLSMQSNPKGIKSALTVLDINQNMLNVGEQRARNLGLTDRSLPHVTVEWKCADAENLPYTDNSFNAYTTSFGVRNVTNMERVLQEAYRVLQPGGRFLCLEFSHLNNYPMQFAFNQYTDKVIPGLFLLMSGSLEQANYLSTSIRNFPNQETFKLMIQEAGFEMVHYENINFGVVSIHTGFKLRGLR